MGGHEWLQRAGASAPRTTVGREFDPAAVRRLKAESPRDLGIGGSEVAGQAFAAGHRQATT